MSKPVWRGAAIHAAERDDNLTQRAVIDVDDTPPHWPAHIEAEFVAPIDVIVDHRREQIVRGGDGVKVAVEVEVDILHRHDLSVTAASRAAFHAEGWPKARLAKANHRALADAVQRVAEADRRRRLALARRRRRDGGDEDELALFGSAGMRKRGIDFRFVAAIGLHGVIGNAETRGDFRNRSLHALAGDFDIGFDR